MWPGLREEAAAIRANLEEMAADRAVGLLTAPRCSPPRRVVTPAWRRSPASWQTRHASVLAPLLAAESAATVWESLDLARKRAVIKTLMSITLHSPGRGARRAFDPATVEVTWHQDDPDEGTQQQTD